MVTKPVKYTAEFVLTELQSMIDIARANQDLVIMSELFESKDYSVQRFSEWEKKFEEHEQISESIKKLKDIFELRVNKGGLTNKLNPTMAIFNLKNNYKWVDKHETDITTGGDKITPILGGISVQGNNSNPEIDQADQTNQGDSGRDISEQDNLDTLIAD
jgi:hypothetical protein